MGLVACKQLRTSRFFPPVLCRPKRGLTTSVCETEDHVVRKHECCRTCSIACRKACNSCALAGRPRVHRTTWAQCGIVAYLIPSPLACGRSLLVAVRNAASPPPADGSMVPAMTCRWAVANPSKSRRSSLASRKIRSLWLRLMGCYPNGSSIVIRRAGRWLADPTAGGGDRLGLARRRVCFIGCFHWE